MLRMRTKSHAVVRNFRRLHSVVVADSPANQAMLAEAGSSPMTQSVRAIELLKRPEVSYSTVVQMAGLDALWIPTPRPSSKSKSSTTAM